MIEISICIATWNRKEDLQKIIELLEEQSIPMDLYEVIVVDSFSPDGTCKLVRNLQFKYHNLVYIEDSENVLAAKRNKGIKCARGEIIVFLDDDVYPDSHFIEAHLNANRNNENIFYCGQIRFREELTKRSNYYLFRDSQHLSEKDNNKYLPFNKIVVMNLSFRKSFIDEVGLVNENFIGYGCEDTEFGYRILNRGFRLKYLPNALAYHEEKSSTIKEYGQKLYKTGLYGERTLKHECREAYDAIYNRYKIIKRILAFKLIKILLEAYLVKNDNNRNKYRFILYKLYMYSCLACGEIDQKRVDSMSMNEAKKGW